MTKKKKLRAGELGKYFFLFIIPALAIYLIFSITPFLYTIYFSFTDYKKICVSGLLNDEARCHYV